MELSIQKAVSFLKHNLRLAVPVLLLVLLLAGTFITHDIQNRSKAISFCGFRIDKTASINSHTVNAEVASTPAARQQGLSGRKCINQNEGMLFVFDQPGSYSFWMKDMNFPIDIIWIDANHHVVTVKSNVNPSTYPQSFVNSNPAQYVIEIKAGRAQALGITNGTLIKFNQ